MRGASSIKKGLSPGFSETKKKQKEHQEEGKRAVKKGKENTQKGALKIRVISSRNKTRGLSTAGPYPARGTRDEGGR